MKKVNYNLSADIIRVLAILGVVAVHTLNFVYGRTDYVGGISWWIATIIESLSRASIPLFIMLSGFLILPKNEDFKKSLKRAVSRILIPLIFWTIAYVWWSNGHPSLKNVNLSIISDIFTVNVFHLYYLVIALGLYIAAPFISSYLRSHNQKMKNYFMYLTLFAGSLFAFLQFFLGICSQQTILTMWIPFVGLFVAGYIMGKKSELKIRFKLLFIIFGISAISTIGLNYAHYYLLARGVNLLNPDGCLTYYSDYFLSINVVFMAISAFILLIHSKFNWIKNEYIRKIIYSIARASFGIYVIHFFFIHIIERGHLLDSIHNILFAMVIKWLGVFLASYVVTSIAIKIPIIKKLFGEK